MINRAVSYDQFQENNKISRTVFINELLKVIKFIKSNEHEVNTTNVVDFLNNAKGYLNGQIITNFNFRPSESFNYTLKSLKIKKVEEKEIDDAIQNVIQNLNCFSDGQEYSKEELLLFLERLSEELDEDKRESNQLVSSIY